MYDAYTDAKKHSAFTGSGATGMARVGSKMTAWDGYIKTKNLKLVRGKLIEQEWSTTEWPEGYPPSRLRLVLKQKSKGTELTLLQTSVPASQMKDYAKGWRDFYWIPLREYFASK